MTDAEASQETINLYLGQEHPCPYLDGAKANNLVIDPDAQMSPLLYNHFIDHGFRRSGNHIYRPHCDLCQSCIAMRLPVNRFQPKRSQRRAWRRNHGKFLIHEHLGPATDEHYALYCRYIANRHPDGGMADTSHGELSKFLCSNWCDTWFYEFHQDGRLVAVAVTDMLPLGLSAVYTFYEPEFAQSSLGIYAIMWQIHRAQKLGLPWLYLGYWVPGCQKMEYKQSFRPFQVYLQEQWIEVKRGETLHPP